MDKRPKLRPELITLDKNTREQILAFGLGNDFLNITQDSGYKG
jgi:hypothetical protein